MAPKPDGRIEIENVGQPGKLYRVDKAKYEAVRAAVLAVLPSDPPGMTVEATIAAAKPHLPADLFPGGEKAGWWMKGVQLDLEAKGNVIREVAKPLRWHRRH